MSAFAGRGKPLSLIYFEKFDVDHDGFITREEFTSMLLDHGMYLSPANLEVALHTVDENGDNKITYEEFLEWKRHSSFEELSMDDEQIERRAQILEFFKRYDTDCNGTIDKSEWLAMHAELVEVGIVEAGTKDYFFAQIDQEGNSDGVISFIELAKWFEENVFTKAEAAGPVAGKSDA